MSDSPEPAPKNYESDTPQRYELGIVPAEAREAFNNLVQSIEQATYYHYHFEEPFMDLIRRDIAQYKENYDRKWSIDFEELVPVLEQIIPHLEERRYEPDEIVCSIDELNLPGKLDLPESEIEDLIQKLHVKGIVNENEEIVFGPFNMLKEMSQIAGRTQEIRRTRIFEEMSTPLELKPILPQYPINVGDYDQEHLKLCSAISKAKLCFDKKGNSLISTHTDDNLSVLRFDFKDGIINPNYFHFEYGANVFSSNSLIEPIAGTGMYSKAGPPFITTKEEDPDYVIDLFVEYCNLIAGIVARDNVFGVK